MNISPRLCQVLNDPEFMQGIPLNELELQRQSSTMKGWQDFLGHVLSRSSPLRESTHVLPKCIQQGVQKRASHSPEDVNRYGADQVARIVHLAQLDGPRDGPRWGLLQRLGDTVGHEDETLEADSREPDGFRLLGSLSPHAGWECKDAKLLTEVEINNARRSILQQHRQERD